MTQAYADVLAVIASTRRIWRLMRGIESLFLLIASIITALSLATLVDALVAPSSPGRWVLLLLVLVGIGVVARYGFQLLFRRGRNDDFFAALLEQRQPQLHNRLINALQLGRDAAAQRVAPAYQSAVDAAIESGREASESLRVLTAVQSPRLRWAVAAMAGAIALAWFVAAVTGPARRWNLKVRSVVHRSARRR